MQSQFLFYCGLLFDARLFSHCDMASDILCVITGQQGLYAER